MGKFACFYRRFVSRKCNSWTPTIDCKTVKIDQFQCNEKICMFLPEHSKLVGEQIKKKLFLKNFGIFGRIGSWQPQNRRN